MQQQVLFVVLFGAALALVFGNVLHRQKRWEEFVDLEFTFDCNDKAIGFYADQEHDCKIFHMCDAYGRRVPHICPNETMFNQRFRICDWSHRVKCEDSPKWHYLNDLTYETDAPETENKKINANQA